ncbi:MAG: hypothetical protein AAGC74_11980 [Verrucomicrobiota bacterium]
MANSLWSGRVVDWIGMFCRERLFGSGVLLEPGGIVFFVEFAGGEGEGEGLNDGVGFTCGETEVVGEG